MAPISTAAVVLRAHDYGDSSRILRFYTEGHGLLSVVARGVRGRSGKGTATVATFASGVLTAFVKSHRDLHTMKDFTCTRLRVGIGQDVLRFAGASAVGELVLSHTEQEAHPGLFTALEETLDRLEGSVPADLPAAVLSGLWTITRGLGFAPQLDTCVRCGEPLAGEAVGRFDLASGGVRCPRCAADSSGPRVGPLAREQLGTLLEGGIPVGLTHVRQHFGLVSDFLTYHVVPRPLKSMHFLADLLPESAEVGS